MLVIDNDESQRFPVDFLKATRSPRMTDITLDIFCVWSEHYAVCFREEPTASYFCNFATVEVFEYKATHFEGEKLVDFFQEDFSVFTSELFFKFSSNLLANLKKLMRQRGVYVESGPETRIEDALSVLVRDTYTLSPPDVRRDEA